MWRNELPLRGDERVGRLAMRWMVRRASRVATMTMGRIRKRQREPRSDALAELELVDQEAERHQP